MQLKYSYILFSVSLYRIFCSVVGKTQELHLMSCGFNF